MKGNKYYPRSYKEKTIPTPHESGRKELSTKNKDSLSKSWITHNTDDETIEYTQKSEIEGVFGETLHDTEQNIYDTIDYSLGNTEDISPALLEALEYYEKHEEPSPVERLNQLAKNHKTKIEKTNRYEDYDEDFYEHRKHNKLNKKELKKQELEYKYNEIEDKIIDNTDKISKSQKEMDNWSYDGIKGARQWKNTKARNAKSKSKHKRSHKTERKEKNRIQTQKDIEKYGFVA